MYTTRISGGTTASTSTSRSTLSSARELLLKYASTASALVTFCITIVAVTSTLAGATSMRMSLGSTPAS